MMFLQDQIEPECAETAWHIHIYLTNYPDLLFKRFFSFIRTLTIIIKQFPLCAILGFFFQRKEKQIA